MTGLTGRREFLSRLPISLAAVAAPFALRTQAAVPQGVCWLDVCAPFIIEDRSLGFSSEIILTSDTFYGPDGHRDGVDRTEYEVLLFDLDGKAVGTDGVAKRVVVPAMKTTVLPVRDLIGTDKSFFGGARIRLRPKVRRAMHASDLFSSAFVRWTTPTSFDNIHANPDPLQWQPAGEFFYSMPFPKLEDYECIFSIFNPYDTNSRGEVSLHDGSGAVLKKLSYDLKPRSSVLLDVAEGKFTRDLKKAVSLEARSKTGTRLLTPGGGAIAITNEATSVKNFGFLLMKQREKPRFSFEHPIHQSVFKPRAAAAPFDAEGRFRARNILYTPLVFRSMKIGGITLDSRFHLSSGIPLEQELWFSPFIVDKDGNVPWQLREDAKGRRGLAAEQVENGAIKLGPRQSCILDGRELALPDRFAGGLSLAIAPTTNHTLMKAEVTVREWNAHAFTHFRPGLGAARAYQRPAERGGLATDYITSGARLERADGKIIRDEIVCVINIDDRSVEGSPLLELFTAAGLLTKKALGSIPPFACRHFLLSDLLPDTSDERDLSLRLVDETATLLMSLVHIDYARKDIALDHGSDRFSTFVEFNCKI